MSLNLIKALVPVVFLFVLLVHSEARKWGPFSSGVSQKHATFFFCRHGNGRCYERKGDKYYPQRKKARKHCYESERMTKPNGCPPNWTPFQQDGIAWCAIFYQGPGKNETDKMSNGYNGNAIYIKYNQVRPTCGKISEYVSCVFAFATLVYSN